MLRHTHSTSLYSPCDESLEGLHPSRIHRIHSRLVPRYLYEK